MARLLFARLNNIKIKPIYSFLYTMEVQNWLFAAEYSEKYNTLPPSQQREAVKRLTTRRRNPLTPEQCLEPTPDIAAVLEAVFNAYNNKKLRSKASSATRRATLSKPEPEILEPEILEPESEVSIVCEQPDSEPVESFVQPPEVPEIVQPMQVKRSKPIPIPVQVVVPKKSLPASSGLASMLRGRAR